MTKSTPPSELNAAQTTPSLLDAMIADFEAALAEPLGRCRGICIACGVDHNNEQRLNRSVISLTLRRLRRLRDESVSSGPATPTPEGQPKLRLMDVLADLQSCVQNVSCGCDLQPDADYDDYEAHSQYCPVYLFGYIGKLKADNEAK